MAETPSHKQLAPLSALIPDTSAVIDIELTVLGEEISVSVLSADNPDYIKYREKEEKRKRKKDSTGAFIIPRSQQDTLDIHSLNKYLLKSVRMSQQQLYKLMMDKTLRDQGISTHIEYEGYEIPVVIASNKTPQARNSMSSKYIDKLMSAKASRLTTSENEELSIDMACQHLLKSFDVIEDLQEDKKLKVNAKNKRLLMQNDELREDVTRIADDDTNYSSFNALTEEEQEQLSTDVDELSTEEMETLVSESIAFREAVLKQASDQASYSLDEIRKAKKQSSIVSTGSTDIAVPSTD